MAKISLTLVSFGLCCLCTLFTVIGFSSPNWLESYSESQSTFVRLGLWEACFRNYRNDRDQLAKTYDGCWWIFSYEYRPIWQWLSPRWFLAVQIIMTLVLILTLVTTLMTLLFMIGCCPDRRAATTQLTNSLLMFGLGLLIAISVIIFGVQSDTDRQWLTRPDQNFLSWSFGLVVLAGFFAIFAGMCLLVDSLRLKAQARKQNKEPMGGYIMKRAPPNY
ncbi:hypothetical protein ACJMK2_004449 [Sinanodonta woodiana]|uniref:Uncharacterized protein n=1 Tax=Sinanodonta woodiana TaxID=1069815 RepID=A0ABD3Y1B0_SINWO